MAGPYRKPPVDLYTALLAIALVAIILATLFAYFETSDYVDEKGDHRYKGAPNVRTIVYVDPGETSCPIARDQRVPASGSTGATCPL